MILVTEVKVGMTLRLEDRLYRVLEVIRHAGSGQMHGFVELKLHDIRFGHFADKRFKPADRVEEVELVKRQMDFMYADGDQCYFLDPVTFDQVGLPHMSIGRLEKFLREGAKATVELLGEEAVSIQFPKVMELKVVTTGPGIRGEGQDNTMKPAMLENNIEVLVPQFIETGDMVRIDTDKVKYIDRVPLKHV